MTLPDEYNSKINGRENKNSLLDIVEVMTSSLSLRNLTIQQTTATDGGQVFAGINNGTVTYAGSENDSETSKKFPFEPAMPD